jgi:putative RecB family exonuclease
VVHAVLERLFDLPAAERTLDRAAELLAPEWELLLAEEPELADLLGDDEPAEGLPRFLDDSVTLLERYFALEDPVRLQPAERELHVTTTLDSGLTLRGYVDRLDISPAGDLRVVDYKTGRAPGAGFEAGAMFQMRFYALVLWHLHGRVPRMLQLLYLGSGEVLRYSPDESDLLATERKLEALWAAIRRATEAGDWRPKTSKLCDWCSYKAALCPAWGGTPPPLPAVIPDDAVGDDPEAPSPRGFGDEAG